VADEDGVDTGDELIEVFEAAQPDGDVQVGRSGDGERTMHSGVSGKGAPGGLETVLRTASGLR
jgi:hypothetical protein